MVGYYYYEGIEVAQDDEEAVKWYRMAAEQGFSQAQTALGDCYKNGIGVSQSDKEAEKWYQLAQENEEE